MKDKDSSEKKCPLSLSWCSQCRLTQLNHTADPDELFSSYVWVTGTSSTAVAYAGRFCDEVLKRKNDSGGKGYVLELASNDGTFLKPFVDRGHEVLGVDPAENIVERAIDSGVNTRCGFFGRELAGQIIAEQGHPSVVFARNVVPHVANLHDFIGGMSLCCGEDTLAVIEVHYSKVILEELHYDSIYHEHLCYFSLKSIEGLLSRYGMHVCDVMASPISGGSLVLFIRKGSNEVSESVQQYMGQEQADETNELSSWERFVEDSFLHRETLRYLLEDELRQGRKVAGYGASARSSTLLNFCGIGSEHVFMISDQNGLKHGLYTAGTGIRIESPDVVMAEKPDTILLLAWNFRDEICEILKQRYGFEGRVIVPLPNEPAVVEMGALA